MIGCKGWLFSKMLAGARTSATIYSIIESAKENGLNPFAYLVYLLEQMPNFDLSDRDTLDGLFPCADSLPPECQLEKVSQA